MFIGCGPIVGSLRTVSLPIPQYRPPFVSLSSSMCFKFHCSKEAVVAKPVDLHML